MIVEKLIQNASQALNDQQGAAWDWLGREPLSDESTALGLALYVSDNGPGISDEVAETLFEPFVSGLHNPRAEWRMGLAIVRQIATLADGTLTLEPSLQGACFKLWLPEA